MIYAIVIGYILILIAMAMALKAHLVGESASDRLARLERNTYSRISELELNQERPANNGAMRPAKKRTTKAAR